MRTVMTMKNLAATVMLVSFIAQVPSMAESTTVADIRTIHAFLAGIAAKNNMVATNPEYARVVTAGKAPTAAQAMEAFHRLPAHPTHFGPDTHTPDPTPEELPFVLPGATDADGSPVAEPIEGKLFGTITPSDETLTGQFDDL